MTQRRANDDIAQIPELSDELSLDEQPPFMEQPQAPDSEDSHYTVMLREGAVKQNLNSELRTELKKRGLSQNGNKSVLMSRLLNNLASPIIQEDAPEKVPSDFAQTAKWRQLKHNSLPVEEPI
jgi:hypothetical protein